MSDLFALGIYYDVRTSDGAVRVSDSNAGDAVLVGLASKYPNATVFVRDRHTHDVLGHEISLVELLEAKQELRTVTIEWPPKGVV